MNLLLSPILFFAIRLQQTSHSSAARYWILVAVAGAVILTVVVTVVRDFVRRRHQRLEASEFVAKLYERVDERSSRGEDVDELELLREVASDHPVEPAAIRETTSSQPTGHFDVVVLGGGVAGLTFALHMKALRPQTSILVLEKREGPAPEAAFKVGEASAEVAVHFFAEKCGMADHLEKQQLRVGGPRYYFPSVDMGDFSQRVEYVDPAGYPRYNIDRGRFENTLFDRVTEVGVEVCSGCRVSDVDLDSSGHRVALRDPNDRSLEVRARWVVDASGRAGLLAQKLGLRAATDHKINAAWMRLAGSLPIESLDDDEEWVTRERGLGSRTTRHLLGQGYWVWLIQLPSDRVSIGVCADPRLHPWDQINSFESLLDWLGKHEPQIAAALEPRLDDVADFLRVEDFSYESSQTVSHERWVLVGEAAASADPLYSSGLDFIAYTNSLSADLIKRDLEGTSIQEPAKLYNNLISQLFAASMSMYRDQYPIFANPQVMTAKLAYDKMWYLSTVAPVFTHDRLTDLASESFAESVFETSARLLRRIEDFCREWHQIDQRRFEGVLVRSADFAPMAELDTDLNSRFTRQELEKRLGQNLQLLKALAVYIFHLGASHLPEPPDVERPINPLAITLDPTRWGPEGLFAVDGMTLARSLELLPGVETLDLERAAQTQRRPSFG